MKNTKLNVILVSSAISAITLAALAKLVTSNFEILPIAISYTAVAILAALAMSDYRGSSKGYSTR